MKSAIHHITAICSDPKKNFDFYTQVLGLRFTKKTVNFDDPLTYHLYYGNKSGEPGTALTFFPFANIGYGRRGVGQATKIQFVIPNGSLGFWLERFLKFNVKHEQVVRAFNNSTIKFFDPDGLQLELVMGDYNLDILPWENNYIQANIAIKGFFGVELSVNNYPLTEEVLEKVFDYSFYKEENLIRRYKHATCSNSNFIDLLPLNGWPAQQQGYGTVHHVAFSATDDNHQLQIKAKAVALALQPTPVIDRMYFHSVYFQEPNNVLFEIATYNPGFTVDESVDLLGSSLKLPPQYESMRQQIESVLPKLDSKPEELPNLDLFKHIEIPGNNHLGVLFHGTGADEHDLVPLATEILPGSSILSLKGNILQNGATRFFIRNSDGTFNQEGIDQELKKFNEFYNSKILSNTKYKTNTYLGYSNGANFILAILLNSPLLVDSAILFHPTTFTKPSTKVNLTGKHIYITTGEFDEYVTNKIQIQDLTDYLSLCGAVVNLYTTSGGHELDTSEIDWVKTQLLLTKV